MGGLVFGGVAGDLAASKIFVTMSLCRSITVPVEVPGPQVEAPSSPMGNSYAMVSPPGDRDRSS